MALGDLYLADKSAWEQARYDNRALERLVELRDEGQLATCLVSTAEMLYSARNVDAFARWRLDLASLSYLEMTPAAERHVIDVMSALALRGQHRTSIPDLILAAIAHLHSAVVLHYDSDYERIAEVTGQPQEWIIPRGTGDRNN